ncbi:MAG: precorrin-6y C5,15-methyltransferase (decarboxylating) subunit CbiE [Planctomycetota bacterium]
MSEPQKIRIIGIGDDGIEGLTHAAVEIVNQAEVIVGTARNLEFVSDLSAEKIATGADLDDLVASLNQRTDKSTVILTTGDPLFYGVARYLCEQMGKERFDVIPHVSTMQMAFARVKESWDEAYLANLATVELARVIKKVRSAEKVGLFSSESISPGDVAKAMLEQQIDYFTAYVCENLGSRDERVTQCEMAELAEQSFSPLNVLVLIRKPDVPDRPADMAGQRLFGNDDDTFAQSKPKRGLLTPLEVRAIALALLDLGPRSTVWDVGAGSGSVSIEAARLAYEGVTYAIEMDTEDHGLIRENAQKFGVGNVKPILGTAPEVWADLPDPDAVFVGGTGRAVQRISELAFERLRAGGRIVVNVGSIDNLSTVQSSLRNLAGDVEVRMINIAEATHQMETVRFESLNPSFLISATK